MTTRTAAAQLGVISADNTPALLMRTPVQIFATRVGGGVVNHGAQILYSLSNDNSVSFDAGTIGYTSTSVVATGDAETTTFFVSTREAGNVSPINKLEVNTLGQLKLNKYTTSTSFTTAVGASLLGVDTSGNVVNSVGAEGLSFKSGTANVELGKTSLSGTGDFTVNRYINADVYTLNLSGAKKVATAHPYTSDTSPAVIRGINTATVTVTERSIGVLGSSSGEYSYGVYGSATGTSGIGVYGVSKTAAGAGIGVYGDGLQGGVWGISSTGVGVYGTTSSTNRASVEAVQLSATGYALDAINYASTSGQITSMIRLDAASSGNVAANGQGSAIDFRCATITTGNNKNQVKLASWWSNATTSTATANFTIYVANSGNPPDANITFSGNGNINVSKTLPTSSVGLVAGDMYTQTATQLGGSGAQKVICIV